MGLPVFKDCYCLELKWGALIVAILDALLGFGCGNAIGSGHGSDPIFYVWIITFVVHLAHFIACILVIVSVFKPDKRFVIMYLITGIIRFIIDIIFLIYFCVVFAFDTHTIIMLVYFVILIVLTVYFWLVIYSWYRKLGGSTPAD